MATKPKAIKARVARVIEPKVGEVISGVQIPVGSEKDKAIESFAPTVVFEPGDYVRGIYQNMREGIGENSSKMYFILEEVSGRVVAIWGSAVIDSKLEAASVKKGDEITIQRLEDIPNQKKGYAPVKNFRVLMG